MGSKMMKFQNKRVRGRGQWCVFLCVTWSSLYRAKYVTRLKLVEGKFGKEEKVFDKVSGFINGFFVFQPKEENLRL